MEYNRHVAIYGITVHDDYQGRGLGGLITEYMIEIAREKGLKKIALEVVAHNSRAISLYLRHGFKIEGRMEMSHWNHILKEYGDYYAMGLLI
jgi:putative acetyltransferase